MRIALFALEALANERAVHRFLADNAADVVYVGLSDAHRPATGGLLGQALKHLKHSGPFFVPYLLVNFVLPDVVRALLPLAAIFRRRGHRLTSIRDLCRARGIPVETIKDVNGAACASQLGRHRPDLIVSFHFDQIFGEAILSVAPLGAINVHPSLLPMYRGPVPTIYAVDSDDPIFGVTVHKIVPQIDAGHVLAQARIMLPKGTTATDAAYVLHQHGRVVLEAVLADIRSSGLASGVPLKPAPYCPFPSASDLSAMRARGRRLTDWRDIGTALGLRRTGIETTPVVLDPALLPIEPTSPGRA